MMTSNYFEEVDYLRGFAIFAVIALHVSGYFTKIPPNINIIIISNIIIYVITHFAVPLFISISGFVISLKYYENDSITDFYKKRINKIVVPYLFFTGIYLLKDIWDNSETSNLIGWLILKAYFIRLITGSVSTGGFHLWFILLITQVYLFYPLILIIYKKYINKNNLTSLLITTFIFQVLWKFLTISIDNYTDNKLIKSFVYAMYISSYIYYLVLGIYIHSYKEKIFKYKMKEMEYYIIILAVLILTITDSFFEIYGSYYGNLYGKYFYLPIIQTILRPLYYSLIFTLLFVKSKNMIYKKNFCSYITQSFGKYSFGIYLVHIIILSITTGLLDCVNISPKSVLFYPIVFLSTSIFSFLITYCTSVLPFGKTIIGIK